MYRALGTGKRVSAEATGFVWRHSPFTGSQLLVHLAIADVVNDLHGNEFWMSTETLAKKAKVSRSTVTETLRQLVDIEGLEVLESGGARRQPTRYGFLFTSAISDATSALTDSTRPESARNTKEPKENKNCASAVSGLVPDAACIRCHGDGEFYSATAGRDIICPCCDPRPLVAVQP